MLKIIMLFQNKEKYLWKSLLNCMILKNYGVSFHVIPHMFIWELLLGVIFIDCMNIMESFEN